MLPRKDHLMVQDDADQEASLRRARADTMPTQSTCGPVETVLPLPAPPFRSRAGSITLSHGPFGNGIFNVWPANPTQTSTTAPTTDQLLKNDDSNTIASTLASLGLDDDRDRRHTIHASHSYSSLADSYNHRPPASETWRSAASLAFPLSQIKIRGHEEPLLGSTVGGRPRAISMSFGTSRDDAPARSCLVPSDLSRWHHADATAKYPLNRTGRHLRSSNSSADLLETIARQRRMAPGTSDMHLADDWPKDASPYDLDVDYASSGKNSPASGMAQTPTRSLWLGNIDASITVPDLGCLFSQYGHIESVRVLPDRECAFVNFNTIEEAMRAKEAVVVHNLGARLGGPQVKVGFGKPESVPQACGELNSSVQGPTRALWIGNIPATTTYSALFAAFAPFGPIESVRVLTHKNCGFVNFESQDDAVHAKKALHNKEIMGPGTGAVRIGFAKVPVKAAPPFAADALETEFEKTLTGSGGASTLFWQTGKTSMDDYQTQMMSYVMRGSSPNRFAVVAAERKVIIKELGYDDSDGPMFDDLRVPITYCLAIPTAPELGQMRKMDMMRLRDLRKRLETGCVSNQELEIFAAESLDEIVELCSDHIGNTVVQRMFERCDENTKTFMLKAVAPYLASIGIHKNGTWAAQKIIDTAKQPSHINLICSHIKPYVPVLLLDQFGNYVVQCCLGLGPEQNQFVFDAIVDNCWEIAQGRFGARAVRATLESQQVTKKQQIYVAAAIVQHALLLATNTNGALLLIWLLDTSGITGRYRVLAPRLAPHLARLCTHKLASLTVLKVINQRQEPDAQALLLDSLFFSSNDTIINEVLMDQVHGVNLVQKILTSSCIQLGERKRIAERVKQLLNKLKLQHVQGYKRLVEEINMVMVDSNPGESLGAMPNFVPSSFMNLQFAAALHAKYLAVAASSVSSTPPASAATLTLSSAPPSQPSSLDLSMSALVSGFCDTLSSGHAQPKDMVSRDPVNPPSVDATPESLS